MGQKKRNLTPLQLDSGEYAEFDSDVHLSCFEPEIHLRANLIQKIKTV